MSIVQLPLQTRLGPAISAEQIVANGLQPQPIDVTVTARVALSAGEVAMFDITASDAAVNNNTVGAEDSGLRNVINPSAAGLAQGFPMGVAVSAIADNAEGQIRVYGIIAALVTGTVTIGMELVAVTDGTLDVTTAAGERYYAFAMAAGTTSVSVWFNGLGGGWGVNHGT